MDALRTARNIALLALPPIVVVTMATLLPGDEIRRSEPVATKSTSYPDRATQERFKQALAKAGVPHIVKVQDGKEFVQWTPEHSAEVESLERQVEAAVVLPKGRNASFADPAYQARFKEWLIKKGYPYELLTARGSEYVVWEEGKGDLVQQFSKELAAPCPKRKRSC
jgi:hypothetical protein